MGGYLNFGRFGSGVESGSITANWGTISRAIGWQIIIRGVHATTPLAAGTEWFNNGGGIAPMSATAITTPVNNCLVFAGLSHDGSDGHPWVMSGSGWVLGDTEASEGVSALGVSGAWGTKEVPTAGNSGQAMFSGQTNDGNMGTVLAIRPSGASVPEIIDWSVASHGGSNVTTLEVPSVSGAQSGDLRLLFMILDAAGGSPFVTASGFTRYVHGGGFDAQYSVHRAFVP